MTLYQTHKNLIAQLVNIYEQREAENIAALITEAVTGYDNTERLVYKQLALTQQQLEAFNNYTTQLLQLKPVQYVLHEAWFAGMKLLVNEHVLIPRPETEELVEWIKNDCKNLKKCSLLDIGTGSGCIALAVKKYFPSFNITAVDNSSDALDIAKENALKQGLTISFRYLDILDNADCSSLDVYDIIVSNPPYVLISEAAYMADVVLNYEPHKALFVPDNDAALFYRRIADLALQHLQNSGSLYFEINETMAAEVSDVLKKQGFAPVTIRKDMQGKQRMIKAQRQ